MKRILIVDDEVHIQRTLKRLCERKGHTAVTASNVPDGIKLFHEFGGITLVISDTDIGPGGNGPDLLAAIGDELAERGGKFIAMSGRDNPVAIAAYKAKQALFFSKPWDTDELLAAINS